MVVYLIIIQDMLVGSVPHYRGVLPELLHRHDAPWWLTRPAVAGALLAAVVCPLLVPRSLTAVARCSRLSVLTIGLLAATICGLAAAAVAQGKAAAVHFLPPGLGAAAAGGGVLALIRSSVTVLAVACLAMTVHFVLCPVVSGGCAALALPAWQPVNLSAARPPASQPKGRAARATDRCRRPPLLPPRCTAASVPGGAGLPQHAARAAPRQLAVHRHLRRRGDQRCAWGRCCCGLLLVPMWGCTCLPGYCHPSQPRPALSQLAQPATRTPWRSCRVRSPAGYLLFGDATEGDVLKNLTVRFASGLVPHRVAVVVINGVVLAYTFNLLCNFVIKASGHVARWPACRQAAKRWECGHSRRAGSQSGRQALGMPSQQLLTLGTKQASSAPPVQVWAVRENVCEAALGKTDRLLGPATFYGITAGLVLLAYALSVWIPSIYSLIAIVGATACVTFRCGRRRRHAALLLAPAALAGKSCGWAWMRLWPSHPARLVPTLLGAATSSPDYWCSRSAGQGSGGESRQAACWRWASAWQPWKLSIMWREGVAAVELPAGSNHTVEHMHSPALCLRDLAVTFEFRVLSVL